MIVIMMIVKKYVDPVVDDNPISKGNDTNSDNASNDDFIVICLISASVLSLRPLLL